MIKFICSNCGFQKEVGEKYLNHRVRCPVCKTTNKVTGESVQTKEPERDIIKFRCPSCNQKIGVTSDYSGKRVKCAKCQNAMVVPSKKVPAERKEPQPAIVKLEPESEDEYSDISQMAEMESENEIPYMESSVPRGKQGSDKNVILIVVGICVAFLVGFTVTFILVSRMGGEKAKEKEIAAVSQGQEDDAVVDSYAVQDFAVDFIELLKQSRLEESKEMLVPPLQQRLNQTKIDELAESLSISDQLTLDTDYKYLDPESGQQFYVLLYTLGDQEQDEQTEEDVWVIEDICTVTVALLDDNGSLKVEGIAVGFLFDEGAVALKTRRFDEIVTNALAGEVLEALGFLAVFASIGCGVFVLFGILLLVTLISMCMVYHKAGQPAWAPFIPIYNMWVLAEIGEKSGWTGVAVIFAGFIPFVGIFVQMFLHGSICIGVAQTFSKNWIFGIGLFLLPFIFYPILAFSKE